MSRAHVVATAFLALVTGLLPHPSASATAHPKPTARVTAEPLLNIAISDGRISAARGDQLTYTIKVQNIGTTSASNLQISQTLPPGLTLVESDHDATTSGTRVSWIVNLKPGEESTLGSVGQVGQTPGDLLRLASVACATVKGNLKPLVCATHSDLLPAATATRPGQPASHRIRYAAGAATLLVLGALAFSLLRRRRPIRIEQQSGDQVPRDPLS